MKKAITIVLSIFLTFTTIFSNTALADTDKFNLPTYKDSRFMFSYNNPENIEVMKLPVIDKPSLELFDTKNKLEAKISFDIIDQAVIESARNYFDDKISSDEIIFDKIAEYKDSFLAALTESLEINYIYGNDDTADEPYIKMIKSYKEDFYGLDSYISLFNTIEYNSSTAVEETSLNIMVPSVQNRIIYTFNFKLEKGNLNSNSIASIFNIIKNFEILNHNKQTVLSEVLNDNDSIDLANQGIYPDIENTEMNYSVLENKEMGYKLEYPSSLVPYKENSFMSSIQYKSFKITANDSFSIKAEKNKGNNSTLQNQINSLTTNNEPSLKIYKTGLEKINSKNFIYVKYTIDKDGTTFYGTEYYVINNDILYSFKLLSKYQQPKPEVTNIFFNLLKSIEFSTPNTVYLIQNFDFNLYNADKRELTLLIPSTWTLSYSSVENATYNALTLKNPAISSSFEIQVYENDLINKASYVDTLMLSKSSGDDYKKYFVEDVPYYIGKPIASTFSYNKNNARIVRLMNYIDENQRAKICSTITIIKGKKAYTMFIKMSGYSLSGVLQFEPSLIPMVNITADTFSLN